MNTNAVSFDNTSIAFAYKDDKALRLSHRLFSAMSSPALVNAGTNMVKIAFKLNLPVKGIIRNTVFHQFCGGESIEECENTIKMLATYGIGTILDYAVEGENSEEGFEKSAAEVMRTIERAKDDTSIPFCVFKPTGLASAALLEKIQNHMPLSKAEKSSFEKARARWNAIANKAYALNVKLFIDSEESWYQETIDQMVYELMERYNQEKTIVFNTYQMYRSSMMERLIVAHAKSIEKGFYLGAKLVRGAYMEKERDRAALNGYEDPILPSKNATDQQYNEALRFCIENIDRIEVCSGSHNERSNHYLTELMEIHGIHPADERIFFAQLYGMSDHISFNLAHANYNVVKYLPYGPVKSVLPYLFRRAEENTSIAGQTGRELELIRKERKRRNKVKNLS
ncbi:MAG: proline dehydrogenase family protein [Cyclobacteriaceae bacterium]|nr:proline dehydrogenase family protein [Cyclobacteriaceae bacterium]